MKKVLLCTLFTVSVCLLFSQSTLAEDDFQKDFGKAFQHVFETETRESIQIIIDFAVEFYKYILNFETLTETQHELIKTRINSMYDIKFEAQNNIAKSAVEILSYVVHNVILDIYRFETNLNITDKSLIEDSQYEIGKFAEKQDLATERFVNHIGFKYSEMYKRIPGRERQDHPEYDEIKILIEKTMVVNRKPHKDKDMRNVLMRQAMRAIVDFFGYTEWTKFLAEN